MKFARPLLRSLGMALAWAFFVGASARAQDDVVDWSVGHTQISDTAAKKKSASAVTLSPEVEKKLQDLLDKTKAKKGEYWDDQMKKQIDDIAKVTGLRDWTPLNAAAKQAVAASMDAYTPKLPDMFRRQIALIPKDQAVAMLDQAQEQIGALAQTDMTGEMVAPDEQDVWTKALHQALTPAQFDTWSQAQTKHKADVEKEINDVLKSGADRTHDQELQVIQAECRRIEIALNLPKDRADKLDALGKAAVEQSVSVWRKRVEKSLLAMDENQRRPMLSNGFYMGTEANESPTEQPLWKDGLAQLLTADDRARLQSAQETRKAKRAHVMGQVMVMLLDDKLALTDAQRQKLQPIADRLVKDIPDLYPEAAGPNTYYSFSPDLFYATTTKAGDAELKPILDVTQLKRWKTLATPENAPLNANGAAKPSDTSGPEDVDKAVSTFFYEKTEKERQRALAANTLKAEDIARVAGVNADAAERLQAAARGATEQHLTTWKWFTEQQIRSQLQDLTPQNVRERLAGMQDFFFQRNFGMADRDTVWDATVQTELNTQQQSAWKKETDAREEFRGNAIAGLVLAEFDRRSELTDDQWTKLQPLIAGIVTDYSQGITQVFSGMNGVPWYMGGPYVLIPFAGLDDKDLKAILTKEQIDMWTSSQDCANATNLWQVVKQVHTQHARQNARAVIQE